MAVEPLTEEQVASWKALAVEVCIYARAIGEVWIVPAYTPKAGQRKELSIDDFMKIRRAWEQFPGSVISEFKSLVEIPPSW